MHGRIGQLLLICVAAVTLAAITGQWVAALPAAAGAATAGVLLRDPPPWFAEESGRVVRVEMGGPAARAGLRRGDRVLAINGIPTWSREELHRLVDNRRAGDSLEYTVLSGTQTRVVQLRLEHRLGQIWYGLLADVFAAGIFFGVGAFVYWKRPKDRRALTFFLMCLPFALMFSERAVTVVKRGDFIDNSALASSVMIGSLFFFFLFPLLLHLPLIFPKPRPLVEKYPGIVAWVYAPWALIAVWIAALTLLSGGLQMTPNGLSAIASGISDGIGDAIRELARRGPLVSVALAAGLLAPAAFLFWKCAGSAYRKGWKSVVLCRPVLFISTLFFIPLLFGLALVPLAAVSASLLAFGTWAVFAVVLALLLGLIGALLTQLVIPVAACVSFFRNYGGEGITGKRQLRWPFWGTITAVAGFLLSYVTLVLLDSRWPVSIGGGWLAAKTFADRLPTLFLLLIPISFAFAIAKYGGITSSGAYESGNSN